MSKPNIAALQADVTAAREALAGDPENETLKADLAQAAQALADAEQELAEAIEASKVEVRVLVDSGEHKADSVARLLPAEAKRAVKEGWADAGKEAIAFAKAEAK